MDNDDIHDLIGAIYEASLDPRQWEIVLRRLKEATNSRHGHLWCGNIHDTVQDFVSARDQYLAFEHDRLSFSEVASFGRRIRDSSLTDPHLLRQSQHAEGKAGLGCELVPVDEYWSSPFYHEFARKAGAAQFLMAVLVRRGEGTLQTISLCRSEGDPFYDERDKRLLDVFVPHLRRSLALYHRLQTAKAQTSILRRSIDALASAIVLLEQNGKVIFLNTAAERLLKRCQDVYLRRDRLRARRHGDTLALEHLVRRVLGAGGKRPAGGGGAVLGDSGAPRLQVMAAPVPVDSRASLVTGTGPVAMLVIHDPSEEAYVPLEVVSAMFGLTAAEARLLLALSNGQTLKEFCDASQVTQNTARTHLKSVFAKTSTGKQSDLVRLMSGLMHSVGMEQC